MFYELHVLAKKGALATVWIAAHLEKRLKRQHIVNTDLQQSIDLIMNSEAPFALRLSSQLLFGIVRIYQRKVRYLLQDCNDAFGKLRQAFVRITLPGVGVSNSTEGLPLPQEFFDLKELSSQFLVPIEQLPAPPSDDLDLFVEALGEAWESPQQSFLGPEVLLEQDQEIPPLTEEIMNDVMRDLSLEIQPEISPIHELQKPSMPLTLSERISSFSQPPRITEEGLELEQEEPQRLDSIQPSPMMPILEQGLPPVKEKKTGNRKMKAIVDKKGTTMTKLEYRKMLKCENRTIQKKQNSVLNPNQEIKRLDLAIDNCCIKQIQQSKILGQIWMDHIDKKIEIPVGRLQDQLENNIQRIESNKRKDFNDSPTPALDQPDLFQFGNKGPGLSPLLEMEVPNPMPEIQEIAEERGELPALEPMEPAGDFEDQNLFSGSPVKIRTSKSRSFSQHSRSVLFHVRNALSFEISPEEDPICPLPKRRKLSREVLCESEKCISLKEVVKSKSRLDASRWFYELLVLKSNGLVQLQQKGPFEDITITLPDA